MFPFRLDAPNYDVYKSCGSYSPLRQDLEQSPLLSLSLRSDSSLPSRSLFSIQVARLRSVCLRSVCLRSVCLCCSVCLLLLRLAARCSPLLARLAARTPTLRLSPTRRSADPDFVQKGPGFNRNPFAACPLPSIHRLRDSGVVARSLG